MNRPFYRVPTYSMRARHALASGPAIGRQVLAPAPYARPGRDAAKSLSAARADLDSVFGIFVALVMSASLWALVLLFGALVFN